MRTIILTGISKGLGKALFDILLNQPIKLICIGRNASSINYSKLQEKIVYLTKDFSNINTSFDELEKCIDPSTNELIFINNAASIEPIATIGTFTVPSIIESVSINYLAPINLTNAIVALTQNRKVKLKIINISSGAANKEVAGWSLYCSTKAAIKMFYACLSVENSNITVSHIDPGVMDTDIQRIIRESDVKKFLRKQEFLDLKKNGILAAPESVAIKILTQENLL